MVVKSRLDFKMYQRLIYTLTYRKPLIIFLTLIGAIMLVSVLLHYLGFHTPVDSPPYFQLIFGLSMVAVFPLYIYINGKKNYASLCRFREKRVYEFTDEKIEITGETFHSELDWADVHRVKELNNWILIYQSRKVANIIPKSSFGDKLDDFRRLVRRHVTQFQE